MRRVLDVAESWTSTTTHPLRAGLKALRARWPGEKRYLICDNFSPHRHAQVRDWCVANQVELVFLPTYGSWLNWIEAEFAALRYFALNGTDHRSHEEQNAAIANYVRWRNIRAKPAAQQIDPGGLGRRLTSAAAATVGPNPPRSGA